MDVNFSVSYEAETETISNPILRKQALSSSNDVPSTPTYVPSSPPQTPPVYSAAPEIQPEKQLEASRDEPARPLFGVDALMDSIKQAIQKRHDALENSDASEASSRRSSFSSTSAPNSPAPPNVPEKSQLSPTKPSVPSKPPPPAKPPVPRKSEGRDTHKVPPPAPKAPPAPPSKSSIGFQPKKGSARSELLKSIVQGSTLRKSVTNDRSAPRV